MDIIAKNKDTKTVNRTGVLSVDLMQIISEPDKNGNQEVYDIKSVIQDYDGQKVSFTMSSDFEPAYVVGDTSGGE